MVFVVIDTIARDASYPAGIHVFQSEIKERAVVLRYRLLERIDGVAILSGCYCKAVIVIETLYTVVANTPTTRATCGFHAFFISKLVDGVGVVDVTTNRPEIEAVETRF